MDCLVKEGQKVKTRNVIFEFLKLTKYVTIGSVGLKGGPGLPGRPGAEGFPGEKGQKGEGGRVGLPGAQVFLFIVFQYNLLSLTSNRVHEDSQAQLGQRDQEEILVNLE